MQKKVLHIPIYFNRFFVVTVRQNLSLQLVLLREYAEKQSIIAEWISILRDATLDDTLLNEISRILELLSERDGTTYYCSLASNPQCIGVCDLIARNIADHCEGIATEDPESYRKIYGICENTVSLFSEAYADMQMLTILGADTFNLDNYWNTLEEIEGINLSGINSDSYADYRTTHLLRYSVLKRRLNPHFECLSDLFQETEVRCVLSYLEKCKSIGVYEKIVTADIRSVLNPVFSNEIDRMQWCESLCTILTDYEHHIRSMYKVEYNIV